MSSRARWLRRSILVCVAISLSACQSLAPTRPSTESAPLQLIESQALEIPRTCEARGSVVVDFMVLSSGQTDAIRPADAPVCVQQALSAWVASFRYAPVSQPTPASVEWLLVSARKGS